MKIQNAESGREKKTMSRDSMQDWEEHVQELARGFHFPPTPRLTLGGLRFAGGPHFRNIRKVRWSWAMTVVMVILAAAMLVPSVRAAIIDFLQIGGLRINLENSTSQLPGVVDEPRRAEPGATSLLEGGLFEELKGRTSLDEAREKIQFDLRLPSYPADLGEPGAVFLQDFGGPAVIMVWTYPDQPEQIRLVLMTFSNKIVVEKFSPPVIEKTLVGGRPGLWLEGRHLLQIRDGNYEPVELVVDGRVLAWEMEEITYRIESNLSREEMMRIAESIK